VALAPPSALSPRVPAEAPDARLRRMVDQHVDALWRFMRRLGVAEPDLDDAMQDVIMVTAQRLSDIQAGSERSFMYGTAFRVASEWRRRRAGRREVNDAALDDHEDLDADLDEVSDRARARALLDKVLATMPDDLRAVFTLYEIEEMTMAEIAELLTLPAGTVASRLRRGREHFQGQILRLQTKLVARRPTTGAS